MVWDRFVNDPEFMVYALLFMGFAVGLVVAVCGFVNALLDLIVPAIRERRRKREA